MNFIFVENCHLATKHDVTRIGHYLLNPDGSVVANYWIYDSKANPRAIVSDVKNPVLPGKGTNVGPVLLPHYIANPTIKGTWAKAGSTLTVVFGTLTHIWVEENGVFELRNTWAGEWCHGYGYLTTNYTTPGKISKSNLFGSYTGTYYGTINGIWQLPKSSGVEPVRYGTYGDLLATSWVDPADNLDVFSTFLLNYSTYSHLIVYESSGHDFNKDHAANDLGHTTILWGVETNNMLSNFVFLECSYQIAGTSIVGIGHYDA